ncbi:hypothetical protein DERP_014521 [Dermatophagoides pteronyssinus]|uniref:Uncharacterized protein n=1 Tax=Dermatophagoides pteronyssinus TaxID=6956 RepID=A0ABQ8JUH4_DERPT|nr:hypothetical protein DERP_014521 [Dermatophagoides pteronyssinus]
MSFDYSDFPLKTNRLNVVVRVLGLPLVGVKTPSSPPRPPPIATLRKCTNKNANVSRLLDGS